MHLRMKSTANKEQTNSVLDAFENEREVKGRRGWCACGDGVQQAEGRRTWCRCRGRRRDLHAIHPSIQLPFHFGESHQFTIIGHNLQSLLPWRWVLLHCQPPQLPVPHYNRSLHFRIQRVCHRGNRFLLCI